MPACCENSRWFLTAAFLAASCGIAMLAIRNDPVVGQETANQEGVGQVTDRETAIATFGGGCFWCVEAVFEELDGVSSVTSGYMGGRINNPTYKQICTGTTGHAEVSQIEYDPAQISFEKLLEVFFRTHDPTTLNRQGADVGTQYRSVIFYHSDEQRDIAQAVKTQLDQSGAYNDPIVTEISAADTYWPAEDYHQNYFANNPAQGYCRAVIAPKMEKFRRVFADDLK